MTIKKTLADLKQESKELSKELNIKLSEAQHKIANKYNCRNYQVLKSKIDKNGGYITLNTSYKEIFNSLRELAFKNDLSVELHDGNIISAQAQNNNESFSYPNQIKNNIGARVVLNTQLDDLAIITECYDENAIKKALDENKMIALKKMNNKDIEKTILLMIELNKTRKLKEILKSARRMGDGMSFISEQEIVVLNESHKVITKPIKKEPKFRYLEYKGKKKH